MPPASHGIQLVGGGIGLQRLRKEPLLFINRSQVRIDLVILGIEFQRHPVIFDLPVQIPLEAINMRKT